MNRQVEELHHSDNVDDNNNNNRHTNFRQTKSNSNASSSDILFNNLFAEHEVGVSTPSASVLPNERRWYHTPVPSSLLSSITLEKKKEKELLLWGSSRKEEDSYNSYYCHWQRGDELLVDCALHASLQSVMNDNKHDNINKIKDSRKDKTESSWELELETLSHLRKPSDAMYANVHTSCLHSSWVKQYISSAMSSFTFTRNEYMQLSSSPSFECDLSYSEASLLFALHAQYCNYAVVADRWPEAWERLCDMHDHGRERQEIEEEHSQESKNLTVTETREESSKYANATSEFHSESQANGYSYENNIKMNDNVDSKDETHHYMSVEALCHAHHTISQGILLNRMQHLEEAFRSTLNVNKENSDACGVANDDNNNINVNESINKNDETNKRHKRSREVDENDVNSQNKINEDVPLLSLLRKHPILQNYMNAASHSQTSKPFPSQFTNVESNVQLQIISDKKNNYDMRENNTQNGDDNNKVNDMNGAMNDKYAVESGSNSRDVSVNAESSTRQGFALRKRTRNNDNELRRGTRRITSKTTTTTTSSSLSSPTVVKDQDVLHSLSKFNELVKPTAHWYCQESEMGRRRVLHELVACESMSNVCFHRAVEQYIQTIREARNALQRAYPIFYDNAYDYHANESINRSELYMNVENNKRSVSHEKHSMQASALLHEPETICVHDCDVSIAPAFLFDVKMKELHGREACALLHFFGVYQEYEKQTLQRVCCGINNATRQEKSEHADNVNNTNMLELIEKNDVISSRNVSTGKTINNDNAINNTFGSNVNANEFSSTVQALVEEVEYAIPFRCTRLCKACQAGWLLPEPLPLHSSTSGANNNDSSNNDDDNDNHRYNNSKIDQQDTRKATNAVDEDKKEFDLKTKRHSRRGRKSINANKDKESSNKAMKNVSEVCTAAKLNTVNDERNDDAAVTEPAMESKTMDSALNKAHNIHDSELLSYIHKSGVCNRAFSHLGESVLLSLPRHVHKLHREVEEELEKYLYDSGYALMEDDGMAGSLVQEIRRVYTQNLLLSRYVRRVQHIEENLHKVVDMDVSLPLEKLQKGQEYHHPHHFHYYHSHEHVRRRAKKVQ